VVVVAFSGERNRDRVIVVDWSAGRFRLGSLVPENVLRIRSDQSTSRPVDQSTTPTTTMRRLDTLSREAFDSAVATAMDPISLHDVRAWTQFAGYDLRST
jgi:hypothetical protein